MFSVNFLAEIIFSMKPKGTKFSRKGFDRSNRGRGKNIYKIEE